MKYLLLLALLPMLLVPIFAAELPFPVEEGKEIQEGMVISVTESKRLDGINDFLNIHILGAAQTVGIKIIASDGEVVADLSFIATGGGEINQPWKIPRDFAPGTYTITANDAFGSAQSSFEYISNIGIIIIPEKQLILKQKQLNDINHQITIFENKIISIENHIDYQQIRLDEVTLNNATQRIEKFEGNIFSLNALLNIYESILELAKNQVILYS